MSQRVVVRRVYEESPRRAGEYRVLVDRLWPRGRTKESIDYDEWAKDATPSPGLRTWYHHDASRFEEFASRYRDELADAPAREVVERLRAESRRATLVLLTASRDVEHSSADVLRQVIQGPTH